MSERKIAYSKEDFLRKVEESGFCFFRIAKQANMSHQAFYSLMNGNRSPTLRVCSRIMNAIYELDEQLKNETK